MQVELMELFADGSGGAVSQLTSARVCITAEQSNENALIHVTKESQ